MGTFTWQYLLLLAFLGGLVGSQKYRSVRVITWNVADNKGMGGGFDGTAVRQLLGLQALGPSPKAYFDIYAISLQENCHLCNEHNLKKLAQVFVNALNAENRFSYELVGYQATRVSSKCEWWACKVGYHGSTHMIVIAKRGMGSVVTTYRTNNCKSGFMNNAEKGIATVEFALRGTLYRKVCVSGLHLDSEKPSARHECFQRFVNSHRGSLRQCDVTIFAGDFNARTGGKTDAKGSSMLTDTEIAKLKTQDEFVGSQPYGGQQLLNKINQIHRRRFQEGGFNFPPTYNILAPSHCGGNSPCYKAGKPPSWTDRIICDGCSIFAYYSLPIFKSDHMPVIAVYTV